MINITIHRNESELIQSFTMSGHALFADHGQDIVCAGASAISFGSINAVHELTGIIPHIEQSDDGFLSCIIPEKISEDVQEKVQLLLKGMVISLQTIEEQYGEHIKITFKK
ncbi:ribosomal-processing cysteine protease Prp [Bacillus sp. V3B]|uniref:ribosomal-processing cysteine protease Prp n=1 Tax=Bacillus sp. V3B TaxID=2804915 RepID=UPI002109533C|nr:ribosomal-processing cysteine protease Prp [Bacillus sp. V3B]MCQ6273534.1 ribosomal-processing cysteine protease Prp [Bacillus sp. V3B]